MTSFDYLIITIFFLSIIQFSLYKKRKSDNTNQSYFLAGKNIHWIIAMLSIVATETSVLTFVGIPAMSYASKNWNFLQVVIGYILGRVLVAYIFLPMYYKEGIISIYQVIGNRYGKSVQETASIAFLITRIFADGIRFLATAGIVHVITGWNLDISIIIIGTITIFYSSVGGMKTILWIDGFQFFVYLACGLIAIFHIVSQQAFDSSNINNNGFFEIISTSTSFFSAESLFMSILAGAFMSIGSHGIDYLMVQRVISTKNIASAKKAMIGSGIFVFIQFLVFLCVGTLLLSGGFNVFDVTDLKKEQINHIFPIYIRDYIPTGLKGLMLAGVLSAAMSSLSSSINSLSSSTIIDIFKSNSKSEKSMIVSLCWGIFLTLFCLIFEYDPRNSIVLLALKITSFTYGGLISLFLFVKLNLNLFKESIIFSYIASIVVLLVLNYYSVGWEYYIAISIITNFIIAYIVNFYLPLLIKNRIQD